MLWYPNRNIFGTVPTHSPIRLKHSVSITLNEKQSTTIHQFPICHSKFWIVLFGFDDPWTTTGKVIVPILSTLGMMENSWLSTGPQDFANGYTYQLGHGEHPWCCNSYNSRRRPSFVLLRRTIFIRNVEVDSTPTTTNPNQAITDNSLRYQRPSSQPQHRGSFDQDVLGRYLANLLRRWRWWVALVSSSCCYTLIRRPVRIMASNLGTGCFKSNGIALEP